MELLYLDYYEQSLQKVNSKISIIGQNAQKSCRIRLILFE